MANIEFWYVFSEGGPKSIPTGSSIVRINDAGLDTLCVIWVIDSDESLASCTADSNQDFVLFVDFLTKHDEKAE